MGAGTKTRWQQPLSYYLAGIAFEIWACWESQRWRIPDTLGAHWEFVPTAPEHIRVGVAYLGMLVPFLLWLRASRARPLAREGGSPTFGAICLVASPALTVGLLSWPTTTDIFAYLHAGAMRLHGENPYLVPAAEGHTVFSPLIGWGQTSAYGPISLGLFCGAALFTKLGTLASIHAFKLLCLAFHLVNARLVWLLLARVPARSTLTSAYVLCPVLIFEHVIQAHVDVFLVTTVLWMLLALRADRAVSSGVAIIAGVFVKTVPIMWFPLFAVSLVKMRRGRALFVPCAVAAAGVVLLVATWLPGPSAWNSLSNPGVKGHTAGSFHDIGKTLVAWLHGVLPAAINPWRAGRFLEAISKLLFVAWYGRTLWVIHRAREWRLESVAPHLGGAALVLFLLATPWVQPWYLTLLVPFLVGAAAGVGFPYDGAPFKVAVAYTLTGTSYYLFAIPGGPRAAFFLTSVLTACLPVLVLVVTRLGLKGVPSVSSPIGEMSSHAWYGRRSI